MNDSMSNSYDEEMDTVEKRVINKAFYDSRHRLISISTHLFKQSKKTGHPSKFKSKWSKSNKCFKK